MITATSHAVSSGSSGSVGSDRPRVHGGWTPIKFWVRPAHAIKHKFMKNFSTCRNECLALALPCHEQSFWLDFPTNEPRM